MMNGHFIRPTLVSCIHRLRCAKNIGYLLLCFVMILAKIPNAFDVCQIYHLYFGFIITSKNVYY